jgi:hypothetical protein
MTSTSTYIGQPNRDARPVLPLTISPAELVGRGEVATGSPAAAAGRAAALVEMAAANATTPLAYTPHGGVFLLVVDTDPEIGAGLAYWWDVTTGARSAVTSVVRIHHVPRGWNVVDAATLAFVTADRGR